MTMTDQEFADKVDYEGGVAETVLSYGLTAADLEDQNSSLAEAMQALDALTPAFRHAMEIKEAWASAFAGVLQDAGLNAYAMSRMD